MKAVESVQHMGFQCLIVTSFHFHLILHQVESIFSPLTPLSKNEGVSHYHVPGDIGGQISLGFFICAISLPLIAQIKPSVSALFPLNLSGSAALTE